MALINGSYQEYKLDNRMVVALQNTPTQTISTKLRINFGPVHEKEGEEGMVHFLEHCLVTGGSVKYDPLVADEIRGFFGYSNASTNIGRVQFIGQILYEDFEKWLDYTSDHVFRPRFDKERVEGERKRVLREIADAKSEPIYNVNMELSNLFYQGHPKGIFTLGKEGVVQNADVNKLKEVYSRGFYPNNAELILVGRIPDNIRELIEKYFGPIQKGADTRIKFPKGIPLQGKRIIHRFAPEKYNSENPTESSAQLLFAFKGPAGTHPELLCN